jgi:predicted dehydrogenase
VLRVAAPFAGVTAILEAGMRPDCSPRAEAVIEGERGIVRLSNFVAPPLNGSIRVDAGGEVSEEKADPRASFSFQMEAISACLRDGAPAPTEGDDILNQMNAMDLVYAAALRA